MKLTLFFSWQSDTKQNGFDNAAFLRKVIQKAIKLVEKKEDMEGVSIEYQESVRDKAGTPNIDSVIEQRIKDCQIFIADFTLIKKYTFLNKIKDFLFKTKTKVEPNSNVLVEYGKATASANKTECQIITVCNQVMGEFANSPIPFDISHNRFPIDFKLSSKDKIEMKQEEDALLPRLVSAIYDCAKEAIWHIDKELSPFITWYKQAEQSKAYMLEYVWTESLQKQTNTLLNLSPGLYRVIGVSGLGKTRWLLESFRDVINKNNYAYCNCGITNKNEILIFLKSHIFQDYKMKYIILDRCDSELLYQIADVCQNVQPDLVIVTISDNPGESLPSGVMKIEMQAKYEDVVLAILDKNSHLYRPEDKEKLVGFSGGNPMIATLLVEGLQNNRPIGIIDNQKLVDNILGCSQDSEQRKMTQTLALFSLLGYSQDLRPQAQFVMTNKYITSIEGGNDVVVMNSFDEHILSYSKRNLIEYTGRYIGLRPLSIALFLISEWLKSCNSERLLCVMKSLQEAPMHEDLMKHFGDQFKNMGYSEQAVSFTNELLGENSPFANAEVIDTSMGSRLFRSLVEVNPKTAAEYLWRIVEPMSIDKLREMTVGRRNLVWGVEKLCFYSETFNLGAEIMLKLALAENEQISNNATNSFKNIFAIFLPATSVSLTVRLDFIKAHLNDSSAKILMLQVLGHALHTSNFVYFTGPEKKGVESLDNYTPNRDEILQYVDGCCELVEQHLNRPECKSYIYSIFENNFTQWFGFGIGGHLLPLCERVCESKKWHWDTMRENIIFILHHEVLSKQPQEVIETLEKMKEKLTDQDFLSRFKYLEKDLFSQNIHQSTEQICQARDKGYVQLAEEFIATHDYSVLTLIELFKIGDTSTFAFCSYVANHLGSNCIEFLDNSVLALLKDSSCNDSMLMLIVSELQEHEYKYIMPILEERNFFELIFKIVARHMNDLENDEVNYLLNLLSLDKVQDIVILSFWYNAPILKYNDQRICEFLKKVYAVLKIDQLYIVAKMAMIRSWTNGKEFPMTFDFIATLLLSDTQWFVRHIQADDAWQLYEILLMSQCRPEVAKYINHSCITYLENDAHLFCFNSRIEHIYNVLCSQYFDDVWPELSEVLLRENDQRWIAYKYQHLLGSTIGGVYNNVGILFRISQDECLKQWCLDNPSVAPERIASMVPIFDGDIFHPFVVFLLDEFGNNKNVLQNLSANMETYGVTGSAVPLFERRKCALQNYHTKNIQVRHWINDILIQTDKEIKQTKILEAEIYS